MRRNCWSSTHPMVVIKCSQHKVKIQMNPIYDFNGQVALVTGAAKGMGLATARMFAESGASVVLADIDGDLASKEAQRIVREGGTAIGIACDVADEAQVAAMVEIMKEQSIGGLGRAEEVGAAVLWLCSPGASFVVGIGLPVDGGFTAH